MSKFTWIKNSLPNCGLDVLYVRIIIININVLINQKLFIMEWYKAIKMKAKFKKQKFLRDLFLNITLQETRVSYLSEIILVCFALN